MHHGDTTSATALWAHLYTHYPNSPRAPEAYLRRYPDAAYLSGGREILAHLRAFPIRFPHDSNQAKIHYLIGLHATSDQEALEAYEKAIHTFSLSLAAGSAPDLDHTSFYYQSLLACARLLLKDPLPSRQARAFCLLHILIEDFSDPHHPLASLLMNKDLYPPLFTEAEYTLVQAYLKQGQTMQAQAYIGRMLAHFKQQGAHTGYYLSQVWAYMGEEASVLKSGVSMPMAASYSRLFA